MLIGVGVYSDVELIGSICTLISRGPIISMLVVIFILPLLLLIFDKLTQGAKELSTGLNSLSSSVSELNAYAKEFNKLTLKLVNGANALNEVLNTLNTDGISKIASATNGKLKTTTSKLEKMPQLARNYNSFSMKDKNTDGSTKFVMIASE